MARKRGGGSAWRWTGLLTRGAIAIWRVLDYEMLLTGGRSLSRSFFPVFLFFWCSTIIFLYYYFFLLSTAVPQPPLGGYTNQSCKGVIISCLQHLLVYFSLQFTLPFSILYDSIK